MYLTWKRTMVFTIFVGTIIWVGYVLDLIYRSHKYIIHWPYVDSPCINEENNAFQFNDFHLGTIVPDTPEEKRRVKRKAIPPKKKVSEKSIFFIESSGNGTLNPRQACAVESAARANYRWEIHVLLLYTFERSLPHTLKILLSFRNVRISKINLLKFAKDTPVYPLISDGTLDKSLYPIYHTSDVVRFLTLYKWGGVYLDLDVIVVKCFDNLAKNWVAKYENDTIGSAAIGFSNDELGRNLASAALINLKNTFKGNNWSHNGPGVLLRVLMNMCSTKIIFNMSTATCNGIHIYGPKEFYPVHWTDGMKYFKPNRFRSEKAYMHHFWNMETAGIPIQLNSLYSQLAKKYCPRIYKHYVDYFTHTPGPILW